MPKQFHKHYQPLGYRTTSWFRRNNKNIQKLIVTPIKLSNKLSVTKKQVSKPVYHQ